MEISGALQDRDKPICTSRKLQVVGLESNQYFVNCHQNKDWGLPNSNQMKPLLANSLTLTLQHSLGVKRVHQVSAKSLMTCPVEV